MLELSGITIQHVIGAGVGSVGTYLWLSLRRYRQQKWGRKFDTSNPQNQLRFVRQGNFYACAPVNQEAYSAVFKIVENQLASMSRKYRIFPEVSMGSFLKTPRVEARQKTRINNRAFQSINSKRVDFLIVDSFGDPVLVIEYHGTGHFQGNVEERDQVKKEALEKAGIPLIVVYPEITQNALKNCVAAHLSRQIYRN
tara:strand:+ start:328 stop:918 length:591 start_codon:yes stop_codon:yes gene_type:complete